MATLSAPIEINTKDPQLSNLLESSLDNRKLTQLKANFNLLKSSSYSIDDLMAKNPELKQLTLECLENTLNSAFELNLTQSIRTIQEILYYLTNLRISIPSDFVNSQELSAFFFEIQNIIIKRWLKHELEPLKQEAMNAPQNPEAFIEWFYESSQNHPAANHSLFDYLAQRGTRQDLEFFMSQESSVDPRFDDMLALAQVGTSGKPKLEFFHNLSDEMGHGNPKKIHTTMFQEVLNYFGISEVNNEQLLSESLACGNMMAILCSYRVYHYLCIGYLGVTEALVPQRFTKLLQGAKRLEISETNLKYHLEHCTVDEEHTEGWLANIVAPAIKNNPHASIDIALGVLLRLKLSQDYCDAILKSLNG